MTYEEFIEATPTNPVLDKKFWDAMTDEQKKDYFEGVIRIKKKEARDDREYTA